MVDVANFRFNNPLEEVQRGRDFGNALRQDGAQLRAGNALRIGDYNGASGELYGAGMLKEGASVQNLGQQRRDDLLKFTADAAGRLSDLHASTGDINQTLSAFDQMAPQFQKFGETPDEIADLRSKLAADPESTLVALGAGAAKSAGLEIVRGSDGSYAAVDPKTGRPTYTFRGANPKPIELDSDPSKHIYLPDGGGEQQPAASVAPATTPGGLDIARFRQAIRDQESGNTAGAVGPETPYGRAEGVGQVLPTTAEPLARKIGLPWNPAMMRGTTPAALAYQTKISDAAIDEALAASGGDPEKAAAYYFAGPNQQLHGPKTAQYVSDVMGRYGGRDAPASAAQPYEVAANGATPPPPSIPGYRLIQQGTPKDALPPADPNIVKGLIEGRITPPTQKAATSPYWQAQLTAAAEQDPSFDMVNFQARSKTRADFTSGKSAQNVTALNTVIGHLDHLDRTIDGLGNTGPGGALNFGPLNSLNNKAARLIANQAGNDVRYKDFETAKTAVANELTRVFRGTGGAEADIQGWMKQLESAGSPEALHGVVRSMAELINSRVEALGEQYQQGMGTTKDPLTLLTPDKQKAFRRLMGEAGQEDQSAAPAPSSGAAPAMPQKGATASGPTPPTSMLKEGHNSNFTNGQVWTLRGGRAVRVR